MAPIAPETPETGFAAIDHVAQTLAAETAQLAEETAQAGDRAVEQVEEVAAPVLEAAEQVAAPIDPAAEAAPIAARIDDIVASLAIAAPGLANPLPPTDPLPAFPGIDAAAVGPTPATPTEKAKSMIEDMNDRAKTAMEKSTRMFEEVNEFGKDNIEAIVESSKIAAKGLETLGQEAAEYSRRSVESMTSAFKSFASVKSPTELFKLQSDYMRASFDAMVAESSKTTEMMLKLAGDVAQPLSSRVAVAAEKVKLAA